MAQESKGGGVFIISCQPSFQAFFSFGLIRELGTLFEVNLCGSTCILVSWLHLYKKYFNWKALNCV